MKELVLATTNPGKFEFFNHYLEKYSARLNVTSLQSIEDLPEVDEPYDTAEENARYKAETYASYLDKEVLATDIALYVDFLPEDRQPGAHARRIIPGNPRPTDKELYDYWLELLNSQEGDKSGYWHMAFSLMTTEGKEIAGIYDRKFVFKTGTGVKYKEGLPLSGLCYNEEIGKMHAKMTPEEILDTYNDLQEVFDKMMNEYLES